MDTAGIMNDDAVEMDRDGGENGKDVDAQGDDELLEGINYHSFVCSHLHVILFTSRHDQLFACQEC